MDDVDAEAPEQVAQHLELVIREPVAEPAVERDDGGQESGEQRLAVGGEGDGLFAPVHRIAAAFDQAGALHAVEVVSEGGALDADRCGQVTLHCVVGSLEGGDDEPHRDRSARRHQLLVERSLEHAARRTHLEPDRILWRSSA